MKVTYLRDLEIEGLGEWTDDRFSDWLHPNHGPLPDHLALLSCEGEEFKVALWSIRSGLTTATELIERTRMVGPENKAERMRGNILYTLFWKLDGEDFICYDRRVPLPNASRFESDEEWRTRSYRRVTRATVALAATMPMGTPILRASDVHG